MARGRAVIARRRVVLALLLASLAALALAPLALVDAYSPVAHTTSEAAAQGIGGAWVARTGFLLLGSAVLVLAASSRWPTVATRWSLAAFGAAMVAAAAFSSRPWDPLAPYDATEDMLHSVAATGMGFAFAIGVVSRGLERRRIDPLDVLAVVASVALPLAMILVGDLAGLLQRTMFLVAYVWFGREVVTWRDAAPNGT